MQADVIVAGAGILGVSLAYHLARAGVSVLVLEREATVAAHASGKNAGMFRQLYRNAQLTSWAEDSRLTWPDEARQKYFRQTGSYVVGRVPPNHHSSLFEPRVIRSGHLDQSAVYCRTDGLLESAKFVQAIAADIPAKYGKIGFDSVVRSISQRDAHWHLETEAASFIAPRLVLTGGAWAQNFFTDSEENRPPSVRGLLQPFARHLFLVEGFPEGFMPEADCGFYWNELDEWYMRLWTGSSRLLSLCDKCAVSPDEFVPDQEPLRLLEERLTSAFPQFADRLSVTQTWYCFRTYTEDLLPIWGPDPRRDGLYWLAAFGGFGMSTGFAAAFDLAQLLLGNQVDTSSDVSISRFLSSK